MLGEEERDEQGRLLPARLPRLGRVRGLRVGGRALRDEQQPRRVAERRRLERDPGEGVGDNEGAARAVEERRLVKGGGCAADGEGARGERLVRKLHRPRDGGRARVLVGEREDAARPPSPHKLVRDGAAREGELAGRQPQLRVTPAEERVLGEDLVLQRVGRDDDVPHGGGRGTRAGGTALLRARLDELEELPRRRERRVDPQRAILQPDHHAAQRRLERPELEVLLERLTGEDSKWRPPPHCRPIVGCSSAQMRSPSCRLMVRRDDSP
mmetsp:Transcript_35203/g.116660  ORF Transcript_35203/g.116660 Transcript_35203/m.116660 type:complete len:269 (-) Transcript_35203:340-1146(-)